MAKPIGKDWVDAYFNHGVDINNRRIFLDDEIDDCSISNVVKGIYLMEGADRDKPISIYISSFGGDLYEMFAMYDIMNTVLCPIHTFAYGKCMSAAPLLLAAGAKGHRWCSPNCWFMIHDSSGGSEGKFTEVEAEMKHWKELNDKWAELLVKHTGKDNRFWKSKITGPNDIFFTSNKAMEWGIADQIWNEKEGE
jgi:ATP-dependent Clp protease protease subunit